MKHISLLIVTFFLVGNTAFSQDKNYQIRTLAFYNLENLFDTINNTAKEDEKSPMMEMKGNRSKVYWDKIDKLGSVLSKIGVEKAKNSPAIIGVVEIENDTDVDDIIIKQNKVAIAPIKFIFNHDVTINSIKSWNIKL